MSMADAVLMMTDLLLCLAFEAEKSDAKIIPIPSGAVNANPRIVAPMRVGAAPRAGLDGPPEEMIKSLPGGAG